MEKLVAHITSAHRTWTAKMKTRESVDEQVELETRMGVTNDETGTKQLYWENAYYPIRAMSTRRVQSAYTNTILVDGILNYRQRDGNWQIKTVSSSYENFDVWMKVAVSIESPSHGPSKLEYGEIDNEKDAKTRRIARHSFYVGTSARVDFSKAYTTIGNTEHGPPSFEVEIEYVDTKDSTLAAYIDTVMTVHKLMFKTPIIFERSSIRRAATEVNAQLSVGSNRMPSQKPMPYVDRSFFSETKALGIGAITMKSMFTTCQYNMSPKTDGDRIFYIATSEGGFGVYPPTRAAKYSDSDYVKSSGLTVIDGELYDNKLYYIDALFIEGEDLRNNDYTGRYLKYQDWKNRMTICTIGIELREKKVVTLTPEKFFVQMYDMLDTLNTHEYRTDGIIFTPINLSYKAFTLDERVILKWKPVITMDFKMLKGRPYFVNTITGEDIEFEGSSDKVFDGDVDMGSVVYTSGSIVEFEYQEPNLVAIKLRAEKLGANTDRVIMDNWDKTTIHKISPKTLMSKNNQLMRKFHGRIKYGLFSRGGGGILLDIGSGRGGDFHKWQVSGYTLILCVEPDDNNIKEFKDRLSRESLEFRDRVKLLKAHGQDSAKIRAFVTKHLGSSRKKVDVVSMMDSLTFFFDGKSLNELATTIKSCMREHGVFLWKAIDGDMVKKAFDMVDDNKLTYENGDYLEATITGKVFVNIEPHVKGEEYYTNINRLKTVLDMKGDVLHANAENELLSDDYKALSSLYAYGAFTYGNVATVPDGVVKILLLGKTPIGTYTFDNEGSFDSCIEAVEHLFTQRKHNNLIGDYLSKSYETDIDYAQVDDQPKYTKFETANSGHFTKEFFKYTELVNERKVLSLCDITDLECSLAFASLLGLDVFVLNRKSEIISTNSIVGSTHPYIDVIRARNGTYSVSDMMLNSANSRDDDTRNEVPDISSLFDNPLRKRSKLLEHLSLSTPVLLRCAYSKTMRMGARLYCLSNHIAGIAGQKFNERIMDDYGFDAEKYPYEAVRDTIESNLERMNQEH